MLWTLLGSGNSLPNYLTTALDDAEMVVTANRSIQLHTNPTHHVLSDHGVYDLFREWVIPAAKAGVIMFSSPANAIRLLEEVPDAIIDPIRYFRAEPHRVDPSITMGRHRGGRKFLPPMYGAVNSGMLMLHLAMLNGASRVRMAGFDGYNGTASYFDGTLTPDTDGYNRYMTQMLDYCATKAPKTDFLVYGEPVWYVPQLQNVHVTAEC